MNSSSNKSREGGIRSILGTLVFLLGFTLFAGAVGLLVYNIWDSHRAGEASEEVVKQIDKNRKGKPKLARDPIYEDEDREMPTMEIDGFLYIGTLQIPSLELELPVMQKWDYTRLKIAPCRFSGSYFDDDLVICGHNYRRHFSPIKGIDIGADVYFVTVDNMVYHYKVSNRETLRPTSIESMVRNQNNVDEDLEIAGTSKDSGYLDADESNDPESYGKWDLCLFTCTTGGQARCAVRCQRVGGAKEKKSTETKNDSDDKKKDQKEGTGDQASGQEAAGKEADGQEATDAEATEEAGDSQD